MVPKLSTLERFHCICTCSRSVSGAIHPMIQLLYMYMYMHAPHAAFGRPEVHL